MTSGREEQLRSLVSQPSDEKEEKEVKTRKKSCSCWEVWLLVCRKINAFLERIFTRFGYFIANHPKAVLITGIILSLLLTIGFVRFYTIVRVEELYIPQSSQSIKDLNRGNKHFPLKLKAEEFIIKYDNDASIFEEDVFNAALQMHKHILSLPGLDEICIKNHKRQCFSQSPLEIFTSNQSNSNSSIFNHIEKTLNDVYQNESFVLSNGRAAKWSYPDYFGNFEYDEKKKRIKKAEAFRSLYFVKYPEDNTIHTKQISWEEKYISYMKEMQKKLKSKGLILYFSTGKSLDSSIADSADADIKLVPVSFILMVLFCTVTLARFRNNVIGHFILGNGGVLALQFGIGAGFGVVMLCGSPYVAFAGVLPFLILGVGIDNMFIIVDCVDRQHSDLKGPDRIAKAIGHVGASITMTTLTDLVAFTVSMVTDFPAIRYFCLYASMCITLCYLLVVTVFVAMLTYDVKRIEAGRRDIIPWVLSKQDDATSWRNSHKSISNKIMTAYATYLMKRPIKYIVLLASILLVAGGVIGSLRIDQSFDMLVLGLDGSDYVKFYTYRNKVYPAGFFISVIIDDPIDYSDPDIQKSYSDLDKIPIENKYMKDFTINWMTAYLEWSSKRNISCPGFTFYMQCLPMFLRENRQYVSDFAFKKDTLQLTATRMIMFNKDIDHSIFRKDTLLALRKDLKEKSKLPAYAANLMFIYIEQFVIILRDTIRNLAICSGAILLITLPYLMHPVITFFVFIGFVSLIFELFAMMYLWNVSLNSISMIVIVMAIGFAVDYSAHVAHAFMISKEHTPEKRAIDALRTMGTSVLMGGASTFIGVLVTAFASSEIFKIFFKMVFGIVVLGLLHGLLFLPVHLSIFCRTDLRISASTEEDSQEEGETQNNFKVGFTSNNEQLNGMVT